MFCLVFNSLDDELSIFLANLLGYLFNTLVEEVVRVRLIGAFGNALVDDFFQSVKESFSGVTSKTGIISRMANRANRIGPDE